MPLEQKTNNKVEKITDPVAQKQQVFKKIEESFPEYRELINHTEANPVAFVFQHSVADGLELAKKLGMTPEEIRKATIENPVFVLSHEEVGQKSRYLIERISGLGVQNIQLANVGGQVENLTIAPRVIHPKAEAARTFFEASYEKRRHEMDEFPKEINDSIADYYADFLPYQANKMRKSVEETKSRDGKTTEYGMRKKHLEQGEKILFEKYMSTLAQEVALRDGSESVQAVLESVGVPKDEILFISTGLQKYIQAGSQQEKLPTLVINHGNGAKMNFNMEATRKPVEKIKEKIVSTEITHDVEDLIDTRYSGHSFQHKVIYSEPLSRHIITREDKNPLSQEKITQEIFKEKELYKQYENLILKHGIFNEQTKSMNYSQLSSYIDTARKQNPNFDNDIDLLEDEQGSDRQFSDLKYIDLKEKLSIYSDLATPELKRSLEYNAINDRISDKYTKGIVEYLIAITEGKQNSALTENDLGELYLNFQSEIDRYVTYTYTGHDTDESQIKNAIQQLDTIKNPSIKNLSNYFEIKNGSDQLEDFESKRLSLRKMIEQSKWLFDSIKVAMKDKAQWLLQSFSMPAKPDQNIQKLTDRLIAACYPAEWQKYQDKLKEQEQLSKGFSFSMEDNHGMTRNQFESQMAGGNVGAKKNNMESNESMKNFEATFDKPVNAMLVTNVVSYDSSMNMWKRTHVPVDGDMVQNRKFEKVSATLKNPISDSVSIIPAPLASKEFSTNKQNIEKDSLGIHTAIGDGALSTWSYEIPVGHMAMDTVSDQTYTRFLDRLIDEGGTKYIEKIPGLPAECQMFLDSVKDKAPRDRVQQIQEFITTHSFYDSYDNEMRNEMNKAGVTDRLALMQERLAQLRDELGNEVPDTMLFAGVCADFAIVGEMMLKESGIAAGIAEGYRINGTKINSDNGHAKNVVMWPDETGKTTMVEVEMTPSAFTNEQIVAFAEQGIRPEPLQKAINEAEAREKEHEEELKEKSQEILKEIEDMIAQGAELGVGINKMELRSHIVDYISGVCSLEDLYTYKRMLESYRFTPIKSADTNDLTQKNQGIAFMQDEYKRWKGDYRGRDDGLERISNSGKNLMGEIDRLFIKSAMAGNKDQFAAMFKNIPSYLERELPDNHKTLWKLLETYAENK